MRLLSFKIHVLCGSVWQKHVTHGFGTHLWEDHHPIPSMIICPLDPWDQHRHITEDSQRYPFTGSAESEKNGAVFVCSHHASLHEGGFVDDSPEKVAEVIKRYEKQSCHRLC